MEPARTSPTAQPPFSLHFLPEQSESTQRPHKVYAVDGVEFDRKEYLEDMILRTKIDPRTEPDAFLDAMIAAFPGDLAKYSADTLCVRLEAVREHNGEHISRVEIYRMGNWKPQRGRL